MKWFKVLNGCNLMELNDYNINIIIKNIISIYVIFINF